MELFDDLFGDDSELEELLFYELFCNDAEDVKFDTGFGSDADEEDEDDTDSLWSDSEREDEEDEETEDEDETADGDWLF